MSPPEFPEVSVEHTEDLGVYRGYRIIREWGRWPTGRLVCLGYRADPGAGGSADGEDVYYVSGAALRTAIDATYETP